MEPEVRYCTTADGVNIAYTVTGEGPPIVWCVDTIVSHVQLEWSQPTSGKIQGEVIKHNTLIRFDFRGSGLSDRVISRSVDEYVLDLEAVVDRVGISQFGLICNMTATPPAITYAARHRDKVSKLLVVDGLLNSSDLLDSPQAKALFAAAKTDWVMATETIGFLAFGPGRHENASHGEFIRACVGPEAFDEANLITTAWDGSEVAASITAPTLVLRHSGLQVIP